MNKLLLTLLLFGLTSGIAVAEGFYTYIPYYDNNPFIFCTTGVPEDCWAPISKELGTFTVTNPYCFNPYSAGLFATVCPKAFPLGGVSAVSPSVKSAPSRDEANMDL